MKTVPKSRLLLLELVADLFIFALCAAVCVALLVQARSMSDESTRLTQAVYIAQDAAERLRAGETVYGGYFADGRPDTSDVDPLLKSTLPDYWVTYREGRDTVEIGVYPAAHQALSTDQEPIYTLTVRKEAAP